MHQKNKLNADKIFSPPHLLFYLILSHVFEKLPVRTELSVIFRTVVFKQKCPHHRPEDAFHLICSQRPFLLLKTFLSSGLRVLSLTYYAYYFIYLIHVFVIFTSLKRLYLISCSFAVCCETCYGFIFPFRAI